MGTQTKTQASQISDRDWIEFFSKYKIKRVDQRRFLKAYDSRLLNVSTAAAVSGVVRQTVYKWRDRCDTFKKAMSDIEEDFYDKLETTMFSKAITEQDTTMLIWLSKTKMKQRGYVEKQEQEVTVNPFLDLMKSTPDE